MDRARRNTGRLNDQLRDVDADAGQTGDPAKLVTHLLSSLDPLIARTLLGYTAERLFHDIGSGQPLWKRVETTADTRYYEVS